MTRKFNIAVLGATGTVGEAILEILEERDFPIGELYPLASERSAGSTIQFKNKSVKVLDVAQFDFSHADIGLFSAGGSVSKQFAPIAAQTGCVVIDNTSEFRYESDVPLIIPEVNPEAIEHYKERNIIANPNCSTIQMLVALKPIHDAVGISRINVATYQSVSGAGRKGVEELAMQTATLLNGEGATAKQFTKQIAFNVIPHIDTFQDNGYTREEMKMVWETQKIFNDDRILVNPTAVRVPVFFGHSEAINVETHRKIAAFEVAELLRNSPGIIVIEGEDYPTPAVEGSSQDGVYVARIRDDISNDLAINLWVVSDNVRKGAALNAVQIAEMLTGMLV